MAEFRLLGLVEVWARDRSVPLGQPRQRLVLAALLVDAGRPVSPEVLVSRVWGDTPPDRARHAIHEYLARIRRMIGQLGSSGVRLTRRGEVYVLDTDPDLVDLHRFRRLVDQARDPALPDPERVEVLSRALRLWRGEPLADLSGEWVARVREGARRQRLDATVLRAQAQLRLGQAGEVIEPLAELAAENPLSEPVALVLMRALHAAGRTVEALDQYVTIRKRLVDDLGTEPGPDLQAAHQSILRDQPDPPAAPAAPLAPAASEPQLAIAAQLPAGVRGFAGRDDELAHLDAILAEHGLTGELSEFPRTTHRSASGPGTVAICAISGTAGVGKTALAVHWAHRVADRFPDGQLYVNLRGFDPSGSVMTTADAVRGFLDGLAVPPERIPANLAEQAALYRSLLAGRRMLVLLDNARDADQVRPLLPGSPGCLVVVTSRHNLTSLIAVDGATPLLLDVLTDEGSHRLLAQRLGADRVAAEPEAAAEIIARCAGLPLALAVIAARAAVRPTMPLAALAQQLGEAHGHLDTLSAGDAASDVRAVLSWSYRALGPPAADLFRLLGLHPGPDLSAAAAASLAAIPYAEVLPLLNTLTATHLLTEHQPGRYLFHDVLRTYATELVQRIDPEPLRREAVHRALDHYLHSAHAAERRFNPSRDPIPLPPARTGVTPEATADAEQALAWFTAEHRVLLAAIAHAAASGYDAHTWRLAWTLTPYLDWRGHWYDWITVGQLALSAAERAGDPAAQAQVCRYLARASSHLDRLADTERYLRRALDLTRRSGDLAGQAHTHLQLSDVAAQQDHNGEALDHARQALDLYQAAGHRQGEADALNSVGWYHAMLGEYEQTIEYCERALALHQELGRGIVEATTWDSLGYAHQHLGNHAYAITCYQRAVDLLRGFGAHADQAITMDRLGDTQHAAGDLDAARESWQGALAILDDVGHPEADRVRAKLGTYSASATRSSAGM